MEPSKRISKRTHDFLHQQSKLWEESGILDSQQRQKILSAYSVRHAPPRIQVFLSLGIILVAIGAVSFVASNWTLIPRILRVLILCVGFLTADDLGLLLHQSYPRTSRALYHLGTALFGVTLFLVARIYHVALSPAWLMILWTLALTPKIFMLQERSDPLIATGIGLIGLSMLLDGDPLLRHTGIDGLAYLAGFIPLVIREIQHPDRWARAGLLVVGFLWAGLEMDTIDLPRTTILAIEMAGGLALISPWWKWKDPDARFGWIVFGFTGWLMTFPSNWDWQWLQNPDLLAGIWAGIYALLLLKSALQSKLIPLGFLYALIFRYYVDTAFSALPKSLFFIGAGIMLIAFGFYFERVRRKRKGDKNEKS